MKKGLAVFSGSAVVHKLMQDGTVVLGTAANPAAVTISGSLTASANSIEVGNVNNAFTASTLGGILVELKSQASSNDSSLRSYVDAQDTAVGNAAAAALGAYTASNNAALAQEVADRIAGDASVRSDLSAALTASSVAASSSLEGVRSDLQGQIDVLAGGELSGTLSSIAEIKSFLDGQAGGVEGIITGFNDLSVAVNAISGALTQEISDRIADVNAEETRALAAESDLQDQIDALDSGSSAAVDNLTSVFNAYTASNDSALAAEVTRATGAEATLTSDLAAEVTRATGAESVLTANLASEVTRATAAEQSLADDIADEASRAQTAEAGLASDIADVVSDLATETANRIADVDTEETRALAAEAALGIRIDTVEADLAAEQARAEGAESDLQDAIDAEKARIDAILSGSSANLDQFKEVVDFFQNLDTTNAGALALSIADINATASQMRSDFSDYTASNDAALAAEVSRATTAEANIRTVLSASVTGALTAVSDEQARAEAAEAGLQAQIDASAFQVNGMSVLAKSGSFSIVGSSNVSIGSAAGVVTVSLKDQVSITGSLSAAQLSASAGLSVVGGASVAGGLTVSSGNVDVAGTIKSTMDGSTDADALTALASAAATSDGKFFYLKGSHASWARPNCWYFCQDGAWFDAPFYGEG